jgi:SAM-dependent methyltransferase
LFAEERFDPVRLDGMSFSSRKPPEGMHLRLFECRRCDVLYASPVPVTDDLTGAYREAGYDSAREAQHAAATYARVLSDIVPTLASLRRAVDIGAGDGAFLERLLEAGFDDTVGFEPSAAAIACAAPEIRERIRPRVFEGSELAAGSVSLVSCLQTIEHVPDPVGLCSDAATMLEPGGALLIVCHNRRALSARLMRRRSPIYDIEHLQLLSAAGIRHLLERSGFERIDVRTLVNRYPLGYWLRLAPAPSKVKSALQSALARTHLDNALLSLPAGNLIAVGYRPAA